MSDTDFATKGDLRTALRETEERLGKKIDAAIKGSIESIATVFADGMQMVSERFDAVDERFDRVEERLDRLESTSKDMQTLLVRIDDRTHDDAEVTRRHTREIRALQRKIT